jgi:hypothetical protein
MKSLTRYLLMMVALGVGCFFITSVGHSQNQWQAGVQERMPLQPKEQLSIFDSNGKRVAPVLDTGYVFGAAGATTIALTVEGRLAVLGVQRTVLNGTDQALFFESSDCTGTPYFIEQGSPGQTILPHTAVLGVNGLLYAVDQTAPEAVPIAWQSQLMALPPGTQTLCQVSDFTNPANGVRARPGISLYDYFRPPYGIH